MGPSLPGVRSEAVLTRWRQIAQTRRPVAVLSGHMHTDALVWTVDVAEYVAEAVEVFRGRQAGIRLFRFDGAHLSYLTVFLD